MRGALGSYGGQLRSIDLDRLAQLTRKHADTPATFDEIGSVLRKDFPQCDAHALGIAARAAVPLVQVPPRGMWGKSGRATHTPIETWLGRDTAATTSLENLLIRYLRAFGPASVRDMSKWSGISKLQGTFDSMRDQLVTFRDEHGVELFDLPDAPRPGEQAAAPVRFVAEFENMLLSYADRTRIIAEEHRKKIFTVNGLVPGTFLLDGFAAGTWKVAATRKAASLTLRPFGKLTKKDTAALQREGAQLLRFAAPDVPHDIVFGATW